jgi:hypothetical protein
VVKVVLAVLCTVSLQAQWVRQPYTPLVSNKVTINYARVINPRFKKMNEKQIKIYFKEAARVSKKHFGIDITFKEKPSRTIKELFTTFTKEFSIELYKFIYDFKNDHGDRNKLVQNLFQALAAYSVHLPFEDMVGFAKDYIISSSSLDTLESLTEALIDTEMIRLKAWMHVLALDDKPVIDKNPYNEWTFWDSLGYEKRDFDVILTNQLIASAEYYGQDMHSALRGGIVAGTTTYAKESTFGSIVFATSFLFLNNDPMIVQLRGGKIYSEVDAAKYAGAYLAHELGHLLLHLAHPFNRDECVMSPAKLLLFDQWYKNINAKKCKIGSDSSMTPGSAQLYYNDAW